MGIQEMRDAAYLSYAMLEPWMAKFMPYKKFTPFKRSRVEKAWLESCFRGLFFSFNLFF